MKKFWEKHDLVNSWYYGLICSITFWVILKDTGVDQN